MRCGFPRFKRRRRVNSVGIGSVVQVEGGRIRVPDLAWMTVRRRGGDPCWNGTPVSTFFKCDGGNWTAMVCYRIPAVERPDNGHTVGFDMYAGRL